MRKGAWLNRSPVCKCAEYKAEAAKQTARAERLKAGIINMFDNLIPIGVVSDSPRCRAEIAKAKKELADL